MSAPEASGVPPTARDRLARLLTEWLDRDEGQLFADAEWSRTLADYLLAHGVVVGPLVWTDNACDQATCELFSEDLEGIDLDSWRADMRRALDAAWQTQAGAAPKEGL